MPKPRRKAVNPSSSPRSNDDGDYGESGDERSGDGRVANLAERMKQQVCKAALLDTSDIDIWALD